MAFDPVPKILLSVVVGEDLQVKVYKNSISVTKINNFNFPVHIQNVQKLLSILEDIITYGNGDSDEIGNVLHFSQNILTKLETVSPPEKKDAVRFIKEQIFLLFSVKNRNTYSTDILILASLLFSISPHGYRFLRNSGFLILPHPSTLHRLCSNFSLNPKLEQYDKCFLMYAKEKFQFLNSDDIYVTLMIDEIHVKAFLDYKGGDILGMAYNNSQAATSVYVFMIQSLKSKYKDVVHILPTRTLNAEILNNFMLKVIKGLEDIGFFVTCIITDNNYINKKSVSKFSSPPEIKIAYPHPCDINRSLFFIIDPVHIIKCIRNNWINQKNSDRCMFYPDIIACFSNIEFPQQLQFHQRTSSPNLKTASFSDLKKLYEAENNDIVKYAHSLTAKSLAPNNLERQNVQLALNIFNINVAIALRQTGERFNILNFEGTSDFIHIITCWWDIMNVKTKFKGQHKLNSFQNPISKTHDTQLQFLKCFLTWLQKWEQASSDSGRFTKETQFALKQTTQAIMEISQYCIEELKFQFVLTGKFQTDSLEDRFGRYRQLAGSQYNISVTQIFETELKLRLQSTLPLSLKSNAYGNVVVDNPIKENETDLNEEIESFNKELIVTVCEADLSNLKNMVPIITYIAGYCIYSIIKSINCLPCKNELTIDDEVHFENSYTLIKNLDRGGLKYPSEPVITIVMYNYVVVSKLLSSDFEKNFLKESKHRAVASEITINALYSSEKYLSQDVCSNGHSSDFLLRLIVKKSTNTLLKNYCKKRNDLLNFESQNKKRKIKTLTNPK